MTDLTAGVQLDRLVAERVMGWIDAGGMHPPPLDDPRRNWAAVWDADGWPDWLPPYSSDIISAWEVIERLGLAWCISGPSGRFTSPPPGVLNYLACFILGEKRLPGEGTSAPEAICRAALGVVDERERLAKLAK